MDESKTEQEVLYALALVSGVLACCPVHRLFYRGSVAPAEGMRTYYRHIDEVRSFFSSPAAFCVALRQARLMHPEQFCHRCTDAVGFN